MHRTHTHTYVILELSPVAYLEIKTKLEAAGYQDAFIEQDGRTVIDLHGLAVTESDTISSCQSGQQILGVELDNHKIHGPTLIGLVKPATRRFYRLIPVISQG